MLAALLLGGAFLLLGIGFAAAPRFGAWLFGIAAPDPAALAYVRALGFRDLALALYIFGLLAFGTARSLGIVLGASVVIPICDIVLVAIMSGASAAGSLALHLAGSVSLAAVALWLRTGGDHASHRRSAPGAGQS